MDVDAEPRPHLGVGGEKLKLQTVSGLGYRDNCGFCVTWGDSIETKACLDLSLLSSLYLSGTERC